MELFFTGNKAEEEDAVQAETLLQANIRKSTKQTALWKKYGGLLKAVQRQVEKSQVKAAVTERIAVINGVLPPATPAAGGGGERKTTPSTPRMQKGAKEKKDVGVTSKTQKKVRVKKGVQSPEYGQGKKDDVSGEKSQGMNDAVLSAATNDLAPEEESQPNNEDSKVDGFEYELRAMEL
jgi:hypothetical protein